MQPPYTRTELAHHVELSLTLQETDIAWQTRMTVEKVASLVLRNTKCINSYILMPRTRNEYHCMPETIRKYSLNLGKMINFEFNTIQCLLY